MFISKKYIPFEWDQCFLGTFKASIYLITRLKKVFPGGGGGGGKF